MSHAEIRTLCHDEAMKWVDIQRDQFRRLGVSGDWDKPYLTLDPRYEAGIIDVLADLVEAGYVFRQLKPIHWCIHDRTALAEAELEYADETSPSIYVNFPMVSGVPDALAGRRPLARDDLDDDAVDPPGQRRHRRPPRPRLRRGSLRRPRVDRRSGRDPRPDPRGATLVVAEGDGPGGRHRSSTEVGRVQGARTLERTLEYQARRSSTAASADRPRRLRQRRGRHRPRPHRARPRGRGLPDRPEIRPADPEPGRRLGPVHRRGPASARRQAGLRRRTRGRRDAAGAGSPLPRDARSPQLPALLAVQEAGHLPRDRAVVHRRRPQRPAATDAPGDRRRDAGSPAGASRGSRRWSRGRPDWCISRQRAWGVPIPALVLRQDRRASSSRPNPSASIRDLFRKEGADAWFRKPVEELVPPDLDLPEVPRGDRSARRTDILDVWFESGSSHRAVLDEPSYDLGPYPAFMYLEGSDQHRGWFQSSILTAVGTTGRAPFETVLTHGFVVDEQGQEDVQVGRQRRLGRRRRPSSTAPTSCGSTSPASTTPTTSAMSERGIKETSEAYRKIRNTFRYLLGNLEDYAEFDPSTVDPSTLHEIDRWALGQLNGVIRDVTRVVRAVRVLPGLSADLPVLLGRPVELLSRRPQGPSLRRSRRTAPTAAPRSSSWLGCTTS